MTRVIIRTVREQETPPRQMAWERERREKGDDVTSGAIEKIIIIDNKKACLPFRREF